MGAPTNHDNVVMTAQPRDKAKILKIWKTAGILAIVTAIEFLFAFTIERGALLIAIFVGLTIIKAYYIVAEFMHLKYEVKTLIWSVILPMIFVIWLIIALLVEGQTLYLLRNWFYHFSHF
ncbi:cytochrome C oxidase subunit IV family protein [Cytophagaceae bacterium ABcell3]|nr:cytochrome C oxidase subunit IV family protein [Cytophagaceae bacterium ABcell3]